MRSINEDVVKHRFEVVERVQARGGTLKEAAEELQITLSGLSVFLTKRGRRFDKSTPRRFDYDAIFGEVRENDTAYSVARRIGGDATDVRRAAKARGIILAVGVAHPPKGINWDEVLKDAVTRGMTVGQVALGQRCAYPTVKAAATSRGVSLAKGVAGRVPRRRI